MAASCLCIRVPMRDTLNLLAHAQKFTTTTPRLPRKQQTWIRWRTPFARAGFSSATSTQQAQPVDPMSLLPEMPTPPVASHSKREARRSRDKPKQDVDYAETPNNSPETVQELGLSASSDNAPTTGAEDAQPGHIRRPRSLQAIFLRPLKRKAKYGLPSCDLQLRSYSVRNVEFFADFALRAAYYLGLPATGPVPLPRIVERWTVPRSNFVFKKSQENFERITLRRLIQIQDGHPETVETWLAYLRKHAYYGIGMKANVWKFEPLGVGKTMDVSLENLKQAVEPRWAHFGRRKTMETSEKAYEMLKDQAFKGDSPVPESIA